MKVRVVFDIDNAAFDATVNPVERCPLAVADVLRKVARRIEQEALMHGVSEPISDANGNRIARNERSLFG